MPALVAPETLGGPESNCIILACQNHASENTRQGSAFFRH